MIHSQRSNMSLWQNGTLVMSTVVQQQAKEKRPCKSVLSFATRNLLVCFLCRDKIQVIAMVTNANVTVTQASFKMEHANKSFGTMTTCIESKQKPMQFKVIFTQLCLLRRMISKFCLTGLFSAIRNALQDINKPTLDM